MLLEGSGQFEKPGDLIGNRNDDLLACSIVRVYNFNRLRNNSFY
jgi:hypothetical protein